MHQTRGDLPLPSKCINTGMCSNYNLTTSGHLECETQPAAYKSSTHNTQSIASQQPPARLTGRAARRTKEAREKGFRVSAQKHIWAPCRQYLLRPATHKKVVSQMRKRSARHNAPLPLNPKP